MDRAGLARAKVAGARAASQAKRPRLSAAGRGFLSNLRIGAQWWSAPLRRGIARCAKQPLPSDPIRQIDQLLVEDMMVRQKPDLSGRDRALEAFSILLLLLCLLGVVLYASLSSTTVVVAAPPGLEASSPGAGRAPPP